ncbi:MAG: hypothetical protein M0T77_09090 [Actinomycetota bacterium]|nr:hypothetical protein [Actinomycetota bacterium]
MDSELPEDKVPPRGWGPRADAGHGAGDADGDNTRQLLEQLLGMIPDDLRLRLVEALRQLLESLRALIEWCVAWLERRGASTDVEVRDIPIL